MRAAVASAADAMVALGPDLTVRLWNPAAERLFGWRAEETIGRPLRTIPDEYTAEHRAVLERVREGGHISFATKRLHRDGFILGYGARLDASKLGRSFLVFGEVTLDKTTPDVFELFAQAVQRAPDVLECHLVAGGFDYLMKTRVADMAAYRQLLGEVLLALPGVKETRTYAVMEEVKHETRLPV